MEPAEKTNSIHFLSTGSGGSGQLLLGDLEDYSTLQPIESKKISPDQHASIEIILQRLIIMSLGGTKGLGLTNQGEVYSWGETSGKTGDKVNIEPILMIKSPIKVTKISCGWAHNICLTDQSEIYVWGEGKFGQLGLGKDKLTYIPEPTLLPYVREKKLLNVTAGFRQSYITTDQNQIVCFGSNKSLELGKETTEGIVVSPMKLDIGESSMEIVKLSAGQRHVVVLNSIGELYGWGDNKYGQLGSVNEKKKAYAPMKLGVEKVKGISCGWNHTLVLNEEGEVYIAGRGNFGQQGNGKKEDISEFHKVNLKEGVRVKQVVSGSEAAHAITEEDEVYVWGWNEHGNLGTGDKKDRESPVKWEIDCKGKNPKLYCGGAAVILRLEENPNL